MTQANLAVANWKMNGDISFTKKFLKEMGKVYAAKNTDIVICPPSPLLSVLSQNEESFFKIGAQDCHYEDKGAYTGDISSDLLLDMGCNYVIIGHSERRKFHHESDEIVRKKVVKAIEKSLIPILCVGESDNQKEAGQTEEVVKQQIIAALSKDMEAKQIVVAYEPIWAIGTGKIPTISDVEKVLNAIEQSLTMLKINNDQEKVKLLYGGSVDKDNAKELVQIQNLSGFLIGSASLKIDQYNGIIGALEKR